MHSLFLPKAQDRNSDGDISITPSKPRIEPIARSSWPKWAIEIAESWKKGIRRDSDAGLGDTIVHVVGDANSERFKTWFSEKFGKSCGCTDRQKWLNARFPYL